MIGLHEFRCFSGLAYYHGHNCKLCISATLERWSGNQLIQVQLYNTKHNCNLIMPPLQSSEVHFQSEQPLRAMGRVEEVSFQFRVKDSLAKRVANMRR